VPEDVGHGADVDALGEHDRGGRVPQVVEPDEPHAQQPRFALLRLAADTKLKRAVEVRLRDPHRTGNIEAESLEALIAEVYSDPRRFGPLVSEIVHWQAVGKERARRDRIAGGTEDVDVNAPTRLHLQWNRGVIDVAGSHVLTRLPAAAGE